MARKWKTLLGVSIPGATDKEGGGSKDVMNGLQKSHSAFQRLREEELERSQGGGTEQRVLLVIEGVGLYMGLPPGAHRLDDIDS